jgi:hypothetical protein
VSQEIVWQKGRRAQKRRENVARKQATHNRPNPTRDQHFESWPLNQLWFLLVPKKMRHRQLLNKQQLHCQTLIQ